MNKKIKNTILLAASVALVFSFSSCKKYEDGPGFSLRSKTARLTGEWEAVKIDGSNVEDVEYLMEFEKDGTYSQTITFNSSTQTEKGEWEWSSNKEEIEVTIDGEMDAMEILRLTNSEFWIKDPEGDTEMELEKK
ncbi:MAG: hypothetical protein ACI8P7_000058 [Candidatus Azotimanducaceae bacterium]|jgi:hypothetical protein